MAPTVRDIARLAGVSVATVSRVTSGRATVSPKSKRRVQAAISELQYIPNTHAAMLASSRLSGLRKTQPESASSSPEQSLISIGHPLKSESALTDRERLELLEAENQSLRRLIRGIDRQIKRWRVRLGS